MTSPFRATPLRATRLKPGRGRARAFTLIEVLMALLVLAIGFLAMAALQSVSLSTGNSTMANHMAVIQTYSILDAMRADLQNAKAGAYNTTVTTSACPTDTSTYVTSTLNAWCTQLSNNIGVSANTSGTVACTNIGYCTVTVTYDNTRSGKPGGPLQSVTTTTFL